MFKSIFFKFNHFYNNLNHDLNDFFLYKSNLNLDLN